MANARVRTLARAVQTLGSEQALAQALGVEPELVGGWLRGALSLPDAAYFTALEIVAKGPFNGKPRTS